MTISNALKSSDKLAILHYSVISLTVMITAECNGQAAITSLISSYTIIREPRAHTDVDA